MSDNYEIKPIPMPGLTDYHVHPDFSIDAVGSINDFCEAALERNLAEICFTTHYDSNPQSDGEANFILIKGTRKPATPDNLAYYVEAVRKAHEKYYPAGLSVKTGVEIGWFPGCEEMVLDLRKRFKFDFVLCGIHELNNTCLCCKEHYKRCFERFGNMGELLETYFKEVVTAARTGLFDVIAHLDYYKKYGLKHYGPKLNEAFEPYINEVFSALKDSGTALEVNTAALRKGISDYYPSVKIINAAKRAGVEVTYLGSDAHAPNEIGYDFEAASALIPPQLCESED